jgi:hypothetical protein
MVSDLDALFSLPFFSYDDSQKYLSDTPPPYASFFSLDPQLSPPLVTHIWLQPSADMAFLLSLSKP